MTQQQEDSFKMSRGCACSGSIFALPYTMHPNHTGQCPVEGCTCVIITEAMVK